MIGLPWRRAKLAGRPRRPAADDSSSDTDDASDDAVRGERGASLVTGARSLQSRMSGLLAAGLMTSVGAGMLTWYYTKALSHPVAAHGRPPLPVLDSPGEGVTLPPFGPGARTAGAPAAPKGSASSVPPLPLLQSAIEGSAATQPASQPLAPLLARSPGELPPGYGAPARVSARRQALERRLSGEVFAQATRTRQSDALPGSGDLGAAAGLPGASAGEPIRAPASDGDALQRLLRPGVLAATRARMLPTQHLLLPKGTFIDCTLETAIDSTLPGMTTCVTATDTFSADGTVVLLDRGTKLIGETRGEARQGQARVFVVWTEARTPAGVVIELDSPGTDALGRSGLEGRVNRHFWQRFGAAALVSAIDGAVQSKLESSRGGTVVLDPTASEDVLTGILRSTVSIPPTIRVRNGARIQVLVARDVDFRPVYELGAR